MPKGFDWKTSYCNAPKCGSKARAVMKLGPNVHVRCGKCGAGIGWLPRKMPLDVAVEIRCNYGARFHGRKLKDVPLDYVAWMYYHGEKIPLILQMAIEAIMEDENGGGEQSGFEGISQ